MVQGTAIGKKGVGSALPLALLCETRLGEEMYIKEGNSVYSIAKGLSGVEASPANSV